MGRRPTFTVPLTVSRVPPPETYRGAIIGACRQSGKGNCCRSPPRRSSWSVPAGVSTSAAGSWGRAATSALSSTGIRCGWRSRRARRSRASSTRARSWRWTGGPRPDGRRVSAEALCTSKSFERAAPGSAAHPLHMEHAPVRRFGTPAGCHRRLDAQGLEVVHARASRWLPIIGDQDMARLGRHATFSTGIATHGFLLRRHGLYTWGATCRRPSARRDSGVPDGSVGGHRSFAFRRTHVFRRRKPGHRELSLRQRPSHGRRQIPSDNVALTDAQDVTTFWPCVASVRKRWTPWRSAGRCAG